MKYLEDLQIIKDALEYYIQRPNATEKEIETEKLLLTTIVKKIKVLKEEYILDNDNERQEDFGSLQSAIKFANKHNGIIVGNQAFEHSYCVRYYKTNKLKKWLLRLFHKEDL